MSVIEYEMPPVSVGQTVIWLDEPHGTPSAAIVTAVGNRSLALAVFQPGMSNAYTHDGVPHVSDPRLDRLIDREDGCWDFVQQTAKRTVASAKSKGS
jgi:hypothetical protein